MVHAQQDGRDPTNESQFLSAPEKLRQRVDGKVVLIMHGALSTIERVIRLLVEAGAKVILLCQPAALSVTAHLRTELGENGRFQMLSGDVRQPDFLMQVRQQVGTPDIFLDLRPKTVATDQYALTDKLKLMLTFLKKGED